MVTDILPSTVETVAVRDSVRYPFQRKGFYARGYHFNFYYASSKIYWRRSTDGVTWGSRTDITPSGEIPEEGDEIAVWLDRHLEPAQNVHIAYANNDADGILYYRKGTIDGNGDLTWDAVWQTAVALELGVSYSNLTICVDDTNGYPFIGYKRTLRAAPSSDSEPMVTHCRTGTGTWSTFAGFPDVLNTTDDDTWVCTVVPYSGDDIMAVYARDGNNILYDVYDITGDSWDGETDTGKTLGDSVKTSVTSQRPGKNATVDPKRVHVAYCDGNDDIQHIRIEAAGVTGPTLLYTSALAMAPSISTRIYGGDVNNYRTLYVFWTTITNEPAADYVCYKKSLNAGVNWTKEDGTAGVELWVDETGAGLSGVNIASSYFEEQHHATLPESYLGIFYTNEGASPDYVRFAGLEFADPDEDLLGKTVIRHPDTAELLGNGIIRNVGSSELLGSAAIRHPDSAELLGRFAAQATAELLGKFNVSQDSAELLGRAAIRHPDTAELLGSAAIRHPDSAELLGKGIIRNVGSSELLGRALIRHPGSAELLGRALIRHPGSAELLGSAAIRHPDSAELLGKGIIRNVGSSELLGRALIRHPDSAELTGRFRMNSPYWLIQGVSVEAYITKSIIA